MTQDELNKKIAEIERTAQMQKKGVYAEYVHQNAIHKIGDIVSDSTDTIRVDTVGFDVFNGKVSIFYYGSVLTKNGEPRKDGSKRAVFESMIKK